MSRIYKQLYIADENLRPKEFSARIDEKASTNRWKATLYNRDGLHINVRTNDFKDIQIEVGRELNRFAISFNYIGPTPDTRLLDERER